VGSQLITELNIREGKNEAESAPKRLMDALEEILSEGLELPGSNPCNNAESRNVEQEERETIKHLILRWQRLLQVLCMKILAQIVPYIRDLKTGLTINTFLSSKKFCNDQTHRKEILKELRRAYHL
jgi:hypothetical protein